MRTTTKTSRRLCCAFALALGLLAPASAPAAPVLGIGVIRDQPTLNLGDQHLTYKVNVANTASPNPEVGTFFTPKSTLTCSPGSWTPATGGLTPGLSYQWLRGGLPIVGATSSTYSPVTSSSTNPPTTVGDAGASIQCQVTGTNSAAATTAVTAPIVTAPAPATAPPAPTAPLAASARPVVSAPVAGANVGVSTRACAPPTGWSGSPTYSFQWLRNGVPISSGESADVTTATHTILANDVNKILQCRVIGSNAGGQTAGISLNNVVGTVTNPPENAVANSPSIPNPNATSGTVTVAFGFPAGIYFGRQIGFANGWTCHLAAAPTCTTTASVAPGAQLPQLSVELYDYPEQLASTTAAIHFSAYGGGAPLEAFAEDSFTFAPALLFGPVGFSARAEDPLGADYTQAGGHPNSATVSFDFNHYTDVAGLIEPVEHTRDAFTEPPPGFVGNPRAVPESCTVSQVETSTCPEAAAVGGALLRLGAGGVFGEPRPVYNVTPEAGVPAEFALRPTFLSGITVVLKASLRSNGDYGVSVVAPSTPQTPQLFKVEYVTLCGYGPKLTAPPAGELPSFLGCNAPEDLAARPVPFLSNPTECAAQPPVTRLHLDSWEHPGALTADGDPDLSNPNWKSAEAVAPNVTGCNQLEFDPSLEARPTTNVADAPSGLDFSLEIPQPGLTDPDGLATAHLKRTVLTLPEGMAVNPAAAGGLDACTSAQMGLTAVDHPGEFPVRFNKAPVSCPDASKVGVVEIHTPILDQVLEGSVYVAAEDDPATTTPGAENPFDSLLAIYIVVENQRLGLRAKLAGEVRPDPATGQLTTVFDQNPQVPFDRLDLEIASGPRAVLRTPPTCGVKTTVSELTPWSAPESGPPATPGDSFAISAAPSGSSCPQSAAELPNAPRFSAGTAAPKAGAFSPFTLRLARDDGSQELTAFEATLPPGLTGRLAGVPYCPEAAIAQAIGRDGPGAGKREQADPSCPAASELGTVDAAAGAGPVPFHAPGRAYLAGPYRGAPVSIVAITPAVAGPFDLGAVVVRSALQVDPITAQVRVKSDPLPRILHGIPIDLRSIEVKVDRDRFTLNPTSCEPFSIAGRVLGASSAAAIADRFQVGECAELGFKPRLALRLKGGTTRGKHPALVATLAPRPGDANIASLSAALPHSEFLAQEHIRTVCTRVQFAAHSCPAGSIYGKAEATTPLLDQPLRGPVYLRSSDHPLPDLVVALRGPDSQPIEIHAVGRVDSIRGGIRNSFEVVPDAPVTRFVLRMQGGKKGLLVNSRDICAHSNRATVKYAAHNGRTYTARPLLRANCKAAGKGARRGHHQRRG